MTTHSFYFVAALLVAHSHLGITSSASEKVCDAPLGLENGRISDTQLSASSYYQHFYVGYGKSAHLEPRYARLNNSLAWCCPSGKQVYLTVDLKRVLNVSGIAMQGFQGVSDYHVKSYRIVYGTDGKQWDQFKQPETNEEKVWSGNTDGHSVVKHMFPEVIQAQFIRVYPLSYQFHVCLRMELYGCSDETFVQKPTTSTVTPPTKDSTDVSTSSTAATSRPVVRSSPITTSLPSTKPALDTKITKNCRSPLGLENGEILDTQLSASSYYHLFYIKQKTVDMKPEHARLSGELAWCCVASKSQQCHLTVDLKSIANVSGIATQGIEGVVSQYFVKRYRIEYGNDAVHWNHFSDEGSDDQEKVWQGNKDGSNVVQNTFPGVLQARYLRIYPLSYNLYNCLRMELYGCDNGIQNQSTEQNVAKPMETKPSKAASNFTGRMGDYGESKRDFSTAILGTTVLSVIVFALITAVIVLYVWRHRHMSRHARHTYSTQIYLTEVAIEPGCEEMGSHICENLIIPNDSSALQLPLYCKDETGVAPMQYSANHLP